jgi:hypothetical protein
MPACATKACFDSVTSTAATQLLASAIKAELAWLRRLYPSSPASDVRFNGDAGGATQARDFKADGVTIAAWRYTNSRRGKIQLELK